MGEAYYLKGDMKSAQENYKKSVLLNPKNQHAKDILKKIANKQ